MWSGWFELHWLSGPDRGADRGAGRQVVVEFAEFLVELTQPCHDLAGDARGWMAAVVGMHSGGVAFQCGE
ncbi:hypothetical protein DMB37_37375 [Nocardia sp. CS682]|nr:hypothetical protein DMB37_37375 [Nocardia sp. CS682]